MPNSALKLVILDRDGTINQDRDDYVKSEAEWVPLPGALEAIARLNHAGWHVVVATNQSGLGRGLFDVAALNAMHTKMHKLLATAGGRVEAIFYCPHGPEQACRCRKPAPGLFEQIGERYGVSLQGVPTVGDTARDLIAGTSVGCEPHLVLTGKGEAWREPLAAGQGLPTNFPASTRVHENLAAFAAWLIARDNELASPAHGD
ncbi:D-glycero-beta-D-manno-heptose 1,7-bisphosphate 7-phosphatase [Hylemonella sp. W303a]|uniref:D-glycero-beta-D-manno-heptose 1,7-bisphosphate 7-phosphatase n=1 Tax=Hylemonella sp. W303a TaxID=3389873 RepID=UPI00396B1027